MVFGEGADSVKKSLEGIFDDTIPENKREKEVTLTAVHPHNPDSDIWVHEYFTPSWYCLPNNQSALTVIHPGDTTRDILEMICKAHQLDYSAHCLRLKFLTGNQMQFYVPKSDEDIYELLYKEIEICEKVTQQIHIEKSDTLSDNYEEEGIRRLYVSSVKETGLAFKKGLKAGDEIVEINKKAAEDLNSAMLRDVLVQPSLCLTVRTYPESEQKLTQLPPRRTDGSFDLTDSPLRSVNNSQGDEVATSY
ncbi:UNVERIFIED_CONTAM: T-lymphoma invasion and metastasis-inducing protein 1 [Gekko kuhli]